MPSARKKCICQLCTCGRHMCPHRKESSHLFLGDEETEQQQQLENRERRRKQRRDWDVKEEDISAAVDQENARKVLADVATAVHVQDKGQSAVTRGDWSERHVPKRQPIRPHDTLKFDGSADFTTTNQSDYTGKASNLVSQSAQDGSNAHQAAWEQRQVPKTLPIRIPDSLQLSGPVNLETTHKSEFNETVFEGKSSPERHRPRTSLKLSGEFQTDSSYQQAFSPKHVNDVVKVKKGELLTKSHLMPEGEMNFDTTSLDYRAALEAKLQSESNERSAALKPKPAKPPSAIKIPEVPLQDETTAVTDYRRWNVGRPERHKPADTLQLGGLEEADNSELARRVYHPADASNADSALDDALWQVSRPVVHKPENNLKSEGSFNFATTHDVDYSRKREQSRYSQSNLETVKEHTEPASKVSAEDQAISNGSGDVDRVQEAKSSQTEMRRMTDAMNGAGTEDVETRSPPAVVSERQKTSPQVASAVESPGDDQVEYLTWDQIRPQPIRPHSNLRQEGGMQFDTTNRSEFIEKTSERVKGIRPKTTTRVSEGDFDATTLNQIMFSHDQGERANPIRPKSNLHLENGEFSGETTNAREYQGWQVQRPSPIVHKPTLTQEGSIDFTTTSKTEFEEKHPERVHPIRPSTTNRISGELDMTTTNQMMHGSFPIERVQKIVPQPNLRTSSGIFDSETTNRKQFQEYHIDRPKMIKPVPNLRQEGSMDFTTMNQLEFEEKPFEKVSQFRPQTSSKITGDFDGMTTNKLMFAAQPGERPQMIKPKGNIELERGKFTDDTTNHSEFQQWQHSKPQAMTPRNNLQQEGDIDFTTTNQVQYTDRPVERVSQIRPKTNSKITGEFDGTTTNRAMYQNVAGEKSKSVRPKTNIKLDRGNFNDETTNTKEFQSWGYEKATPIKPHSSIRQEGSMDFTTTNSLQFEGKQGERTTQIRPTTATKVTGDFDGRTTNQMMFQQNNVAERIKGKRPSTNIHLESGRFEDQTTARREYQQWDVAKAQPIRPSESLMQEGSMDLMTSNQTEFGEKPMTRTEQIRPHTSSKVTGDFDGTTTNQVMYQAQPLDKTHDIRPRDNLRVQSGEFKGETTTSQEYGYKVGSKSEAIKPKPSLAQEGDFNFVTSNQLEFDEKNIDRVAKTRPKTQTKASDGKFYGTTTNQAMFQTPDMETVHSVRPHTNLRVEEGAFQGNTTATDAYQQWKTERPKAFQLVSSLRQEGDMNFETTNSSEFNQKGFDRVQQIRPKTTSKIEGDFDPTTMNQIMFHQPEKLDRVKPIRHENNIHLEAGKFDDETTTSREYRQWIRPDHKIAVPKKKLQTAGLKTQRDRPVGRKHVPASPEQNVESTPQENGHESWRLDDNDVRLEADAKSAEASADGKGTAAAAENEVSSSKIEGAAGPDTQEDGGKEVQSLAQAAAADGGGDVDISTTMADYVTKAPSKVDSITPHSNFVSSEGDMTFSTTNKSDYPQESAVGNEKMTAAGTSSNAPNYESWKLENGERVGKVEGTAEQQSRRAEVATVRAPKRYRPADNLKIEHVPFDGDSTTRAEYKRWEGRRSSSKRRGENLKQEGKMQFDTTSSDYSTARAGLRANQRASKNRKKTDLQTVLAQTGNMEFSTTSKSSYVGVGAGSRARNLRPRSSLRLGGHEDSSRDAAMSSTRSNPETSTRDHADALTSTSRAAYVGHSTSRRVRAHRPSTSQKVGEGQFQGQTTTRSTFKVPQDNVKSRSFRPENHNILNGDSSSFVGNTTYRSSFETAKPGHCPVLDLEAGRLPLVLNEEKNGHLFYAPRVQG